MSSEFPPMDGAQATDLIGTTAIQAIQLLDLPPAPLLPLSSSKASTPAPDDPGMSGAPRSMPDVLNPRVEALAQGLEDGARPRSRASSGAPRGRTRTPRPATPQEDNNPALAASTSSNTGGGSSTPTGQVDNGRPLNVTDALGYLDNVKAQFAEQPDVYNHFLDIMKDFKSQIIDTPGVIERVSMLFQGNPELIQGFNTFLPPGYHIQCSKDSRDSNQITVTTPMGTIAHAGGHGHNPLRFPRDAYGAPAAIPPSMGMGAPRPATTTTTGTGTGSNTPLLPTPNGNGGGAPQFGSGLPLPLPALGTGVASRSTTPLPSIPHHIHLQHAFVPGVGPYSPGIPGGPSTSQAASFLGGLSTQNRPPTSSGGSTNAGTPVVAAERSQTDFNHAIHYLNQIKTRFADDPNTYKQFLEILQAYQKDQRAIQDSQVYAQVQILFKDAPELLDEFMAFLPRVTGPPPPSASNELQIGPVGVPHPSGGSVIASGSGWKEESAPPALPDPTPEPSRTQPKRKRKPGEAEQETIQPKASSSSSRAKKPRIQPQVEHSPPISPRAVPVLSPSPAYTTVQAPDGQTSYLPVPQPAPAPLPSMHVAHPGQPRPTPDHVLFFEHVKKLLVVRDAYDDFLRLLDLYTNDVIDVRTLIRRAERFLGDGELLMQFKDLMGWENRMLNANRGPPGSIRAKPLEKEISLPREDEGQGPSYRRLPDTEIYLACSFRSELERSVLNDHWVSHPTFASEDVGFVAHKKNSFEEVIHKCEEERHEYAVHLQGLARTIAVLEPLNQRIEEMDNAERAYFKLRPDLGGPAGAIYLRTIKKIYGLKVGEEIYQSLQDCTSVAVPVVLDRLRAKDAEWRTIQREWSRTWREVDHKNYYKGLDHQGIRLKLSDKKSLTAKHFVSEIKEERDEHVQRAQNEAEQHGRRPAWASGSSGPHMRFAFADKDVLRDTVRVVFAYLDRNHGQYISAERRGLEKFLREFVPCLYRLPPAEFDFPGSTGPRVMSTSTSPRERRREMSVDDERNHAKDNRRSSSREADTEGGTWIREDTASAPEGETLESPPVTRLPLFVNTTFYALSRLLQRIYSTLEMCKQIGAGLAEENYASMRPNRVAVELGLDDVGGPTTVLEQAIASHTPPNASVEEAAKANVIYAYLLEALDKVFDGELDQTTFEEHMRWFFGNSAYQTFAVEKTVQAFIKQVQSVLGDNRSHELWELMQKMRAQSSVSQQDVIRYRREAEENVAGDDHLYRFDWDSSSQTLGIRLMNSQDPSVDGGEEPRQRWREYVDSFIMRHPTEWQVRAKDRTGNSKIGRLLLKRNVSEGGQAARVLQDDLKIRISLGSYRLFYGAGGEETVFRKEHNAIEAGVLEERARARREERGRVWVAKYRG